jgi:PAS domain S-box-containing protein
MAADETEYSQPPADPSEEQLLRLLLDGVEDYAIYVLDPAGIVVTWNTGATRLKGYTREEAIGRHHERFFSPEDRQAGKPQALLALAARVGHAEDEGWRVRKDGARFWGYETYSALYDAGGRLIGFAKTTRDRTEHRTYENRISQLNRLYLTLSESSQAIVHEREMPALFHQICRIAVARGGFRLAWIGMSDPATQRLHIAGWAGLEAATISELETTLQARGQATESLAAALRRDGRVVVQDVLADPQMRFWRLAAERYGYRATAMFALMVFGQVRGVFTLCAAAPDYFDEEQVHLLNELADDIGFALEAAEVEQQRQQTVQELRNSEARYRSLIAYAPDAIFVNLDDKVVLVNDACVRLFGATDPSQLLGQSPFELFTAPYHAQIRERIHRLRVQGEPVGAAEEQIVRLDGKLVDVEVKAGPFRYGEANAIHVILHDITPRKGRQAELLRLNAELEQRVAERTAELQLRNRELETFTYSVSHDLKAPLRGIDGYSRLLEEDYGDRLDENGRRFISTIRRATQHMNQLIEDLLAYSRLERRTLQPAWVSPLAITRALLAEREDEISRNGVQIRVTVPDIRLNVDQEGLVLALRNLLDNALKFTRGATEPMIEVGGDVSGNLCTLWVNDNGIGFDMQHHDRIFEIFQRLHRADEYTGTGVGLAIVRKAIERMGGRTWARSEPGAATTFYLEVPIT